MLAGTPCSHRTTMLDLTPCSPCPHAPLPYYDATPDPILARTPCSHRTTMLDLTPCSPHARHASSRGRAHHRIQDEWVEPCGRSYAGKCYDARPDPMLRLTPCSALPPCSARC